MFKTGCHFGSKQRVKMKHHLATTVTWRQCRTFSLCKSSSVNSRPSCKANAASFLTPPKQKGKAFQERKWSLERATARVTKRVHSFSFRHTVISALTHTEMSQTGDYKMSFISFYFSFCLHSYRSYSVQTDYIEWRKLPLLTQHRPCAFQSL